MPLINGSGINEQKGPDTASSRSDVVVWYCIVYIVDQLTDTEVEEMHAFNGYPTVHIGTGANHLQRTLCFWRYPWRMHSMWSLKKIKLRRVGEC